MNHSDRRLQNEIRSIEKQLPLFQQKVSDLERRRTELNKVLAEQQPESITETSALIPTSDRPEAIMYSHRYAQLLPPINERKTEVEVEKKPNPDTDQGLSLLSLQSRENFIGILAEAGQKLRSLYQVVNRAAVNMEFVLFIINFLSQNNPNMQYLMSIAEAVRVQNEASPSENLSSSVKGTDEQNSVNTSRMNLTPETVSEIMKSPLFQQLLANFNPEKPKE